MKWPKIISPRTNVTAESAGIVDDPTNKLTPSRTVGFDGTIEHRRIERSGGGCQIIEDIFVNPDPNSPVAAVVINQNTLNQVSIDLVVRQGQRNSLNDAINHNDLSFGGMVTGVSNIAGTLTELGLLFESHAMTLLAHYGRIEDNHSEIAELGKKVIGAFKNTDIISTDPAIRDAMVEAMGNVLMSVKEIAGDNSRQIGKG